MYRDQVMLDIWSERRTVCSWLDAEAALARAQADAGVISADDAEAIAAAAVYERLDLGSLWGDTKVVGYPVLPLVRAIAKQLPDGPDGRVHYGATTQDIMDTGLALQLRDSLTRLDELAQAWGDAIARIVRRHRDTPQAARTHAQQAVPTTFGAKMATYLVELHRHRRRIADAAPRVGMVSLFGAGGTGAALGDRAGAVRARMAAHLGLVEADVPWHVVRDGVAEFGFVAAGLASSAARLAHEVIALSRTEIDEVREADGHHRGASSTMPQKANPISSEAIVGLAATAQELVPALLRAMTAGHERAAGEWQIEWQVVPDLAALSAAALATAIELTDGLSVRPEQMARNMRINGGAIMSEAYMMALAPAFGRERAHDEIYAAVRAASRNDHTLDDAVRDRLPESASVLGEGALQPEGYLGDTGTVCDTALRIWEGRAAREDDR